MWIRVLGVVQPVRSRGQAPAHLNWDGGATETGLGNPCPARSYVSGRWLGEGGRGSIDQSSEEPERTAGALGKESYTQATELRLCPPGSGKPCKVISKGATAKFWCHIIWTRVYESLGPEGVRLLLGLGPGCDLCLCTVFVAVAAAPGYV